MTVPSALTAPQLRFVWESGPRPLRQASGRRSGPLHHLHRADETAAGRTGRPARQEPAARPHRDLPHRPTRPAPARFSDAAMTARQVAELLCGPIVNRPAPAAGCPPGPRADVGRARASRRPRLAGWIHHLRVSGTGTRLAAAAGMATDQLVTEAPAVVPAARRRDRAGAAGRAGHRRPARARSGPSAPHARAPGGVAPDRRANADSAVVGYPAGCTRDRRDLPRQRVHRCARPGAAR